MAFLIHLDSTSGIPLHRQIYDEIRDAILSGRLRAGDKLPSTRSLSSTLGIARATVTMSFDSLLSEGYIECIVGSGTFVSRQLPEQLMEAEIENKDDPFIDFFGGVAAVKIASENKVERFSVEEMAAPRRLSWYGSSLLDREWLGFSSEEPTIQLSFGRPAMTQFPMRIWNQLLLHHARKRKLGMLDSPANAAGFQPLREALAEYLSRSRAVNCSPEQVIIVNGSQQGIDLVARILIDKGDDVCIEEPGYIGAQKTFEAQGATVWPVPVDKNGIVIDTIKERVAGKSAFLPRLVYVTPSHQSPTGVVLSVPRRLDLIAWAKKTGAYIVEDDYDSEYRYKGRPIPALAGFDHGGTVIYIGTLSKVLFPALRLGYLVVPPELVEVFTRAKWLADRHSPLLEQQVLCDFIVQGHLDRHVRRMRKLYERKRKTVIEALTNHFGNRISVLGDAAGINVVMRIKTGLSDDAIVQQAAQAGIGISSTNHCYLGKSPEGEFLFNYADLQDPQIEYCISRLAEITA